jgi:D-glycero-alpha-D-manno-heptose-7-phosphate kinase
LIIVRAPLRVSLLGGGTDMPQFTRFSNGMTLNFAISKYIYISIHNVPESNEIALRYSRTETVSAADSIRHPVFREVLKRYPVKGVEISVSSDVPAGTGLGSSSAFTVALLWLVRSYLSLPNNQEEIAREACDIEINVLQESIGAQDQYITSKGGLRQTEYYDGYNIISKDYINAELQHFIEKCSALIRYKGDGTRSASKVILDQLGNPNWFDKTSKINDVARDFFKVSNPSVYDLATAINESWKIKSTLSSSTAPEELKQILDRLHSMGFLACKLLGAGGSGYIFALGQRPIQHEVFEGSGTEALSFRIDWSGVSTIHESERS